MDVTCERCGTEYEFDETLVAARGTTVKCTNCGHLFKVFRPGAAGAAGAAESKSWAVRRGNGATESIASLKELQRLITVGQLTPEDQISRSGEGWKRLGDIAELQTFFAAAQAARAERRDPTGRQGGREPTGSGRVSDRRAYAPTVETHATDRPPPPPSQPPPYASRGGKSTMLGMGGASQQKKSPPPSGDDIRGRTLEVAVPPPPAGANGAPSSAGSASAPRPMPPGAAQARPPAPPRAAPPSSRPPPPAASTPPPIPAPPRTPSFPETQMDLGAASAEAIASERASRPRRSAQTVPRSAPISSAPPAARDRGSVRPLHVDDDDDLPVRPRGRSWSGLWVALVLLLAIGGGVAAGWDRIAALIAAPEQSDPAAPFVSAGADSLRLDHEDAYDDAIAHYTKALAFREHDPRALAGLSRAHALIAQQRIFEASDLEARAGDDAALRAEAATMRRQATGHVEEARESAEEATRHGPGDGDVEIALSDALRLSGDPTLAASRLARGRTLQSEPSAEALRVEALLAAGEAGNMAAARSLAERAVAEDPGLIRARLLLARAQLAAGDVSSAQAQIQAVLDRVTDHPIAIALREAIREGRPPASPVVGGEAGAPPGTTPTVGAPPSTPPTTIPAEGAAEAAPATPPTTTTQAAAAESGGGGGSRGYEALVREADGRLENGDTRRARALYEQALRARAGGAEATAGMGFVMLAEGNARGAIAQLQSAVDRGYADALIGLGDAHRRLGDRAEALRAYERYLERSPSGPRASIARRQADRLRAELGAAGGGGGAAGGSPGESSGGPAATGGDTSGGDTTGGGTTGGGTTGGGTTGGGAATEAPPTAAEELPGPRGATEAPPQDLPAIDSEP